jgi:hypothetical protein
VNDPRFDSSQYGKMSDLQLRDQLVLVSHHLSYLHSELGFQSKEQHKAFLTEYIKSPGGSVAAKNREAEYNTREYTAEVISIRAQINDLTTNRDLIVFLLLARQPTTLTEYPPAVVTEGGLLSV